MWCGKAAQVAVLQWHVLEKKKKHKKQADMVLLVSPKVSLGNFCSLLNPLAAGLNLLSEIRFLFTQHLFYAN